MAEEQKDLTPADFERMAADIDSKGFTEIPEERPSAEPAGEKPEESESHVDAETKPTDQPKAEEAEGEQEREPETREESEYTRAKKDKERLDRNWNKQQELADQVRRDREAFEAEKAEWRKQRETTPGEVAGDKDEKGYSAADYERAVEEFLLEGNKDSADYARERAKTLRVQTHQRLWKENVDVVKRENPGIDNPENPLHKASMKVLQEMPVLNVFPDGPRHAVRIAKAEMNTSLVSGLRSENEKLKNEIKRLNGNMEVGGSGPMRIPSERDLDSMPMKEQERELARLADEADRLGLV
jgi:hypothetical protein